MSEQSSYSFAKIPEEFYYEFFSEGPKGNIKKVVRYRLIEGSAGNIYNLGFGDWNDETGDIDYHVNTNNADSQKVLITVADTVLDFIQHHPEAIIFIQGSTASRTRLYQMEISTFWENIHKLFVIVGYVNDDWRPFEKGINYDAFLIIKRN
jgi:hypothetical protein